MYQIKNQTRHVLHVKGRHAVVMPDEVVEVSELPDNMGQWKDVSVKKPKVKKEKTKPEVKEND